MYPRLVPPPSSRRDMIACQETTPLRSDHDQGEPDSTLAQVLSIISNLLSLASTNSTSNVVSPSSASRNIKQGSISTRGRDDYSMLGKRTKPISKNHRASGCPSRQSHVRPSRRARPDWDLCMQQQNTGPASTEPAGYEAMQVHAPVVSPSVSDVVSPGPCGVRDDGSACVATEIRTVEPVDRVRLGT